MPALLQTFPCLILLICEVRVIFCVTEVKKLNRFSVLARKRGDGGCSGCRQRSVQSCHLGCTCLLSPSPLLWNPWFLWPWVCELLSFMEEVGQSKQPPSVPWLLEGWWPTLRPGPGHHGPCLSPSPFRCRASTVLLPACPQAPTGWGPCGEACEGTVPQSCHLTPSPAQSPLCPSGVGGAGSPAHASVPPGDGTLYTHHSLSEL